MLLVVSISGIICHTGIIIYLGFTLRQANRAKYPAMLGLMRLFLISNVLTLVSFVFHASYLFKEHLKKPKLMFSVFALLWTAAKSTYIITHWLFAHNYWIFSLTLPQILDRKFPTINERREKCVKWTVLTLSVVLSLVTGVLLVIDI